MAKIIIPFISPEKGKRKTEKNSVETFSNTDSGWSDKAEENADFSKPILFLFSKLEDGQIPHHTAFNNS